jgi:DNA repair photolyase
MERAAAAGAIGAYYSTLRLSHELKDLFREWLAAEQPGRAAHVMSLVRQLRGGRDNDPRFGKRMTGEGPLAELLARRFRLTRQRLGLSDRFPALNTGLFRAPARSGDQLSLL